MNVSTLERPIPDAGDAIRHDWARDEIEDLYRLPLLDLVWRAHGVHRAFQDPHDIQHAGLLSIKTGGCPEDCAYCPQSAHHKEVRIDRDGLMAVDAVLEMAERAKNDGASRFCMGAAWRQVRDGQAFDDVLAMVRGVRALDMEACVTLGMLDENQAHRLAEAGLTAYNHNLDTGPEYYPSIVTTRTYQDRLETLKHARAAGLELCCGGIIGMGESIADRAAMLQVLANMNPHPESVPINVLVPVDGTPLENAPPVHPLDLVRMIATARIVTPASRVRLSAGRRDLSPEAQAFCFMAGANSIFHGDSLLTTANAQRDSDAALMCMIGPQD
ncbi:biotin synthase BioB [Varunaivibrio sulfuroxidans]|nr:biotin synthase BioB [Varunaivibrio sulfuroxidans]WES31966.1 biotin synthase BioB [Varunaivibrio sulfuroxidans]